MNVIHKRSFTCNLLIGLHFFLGIEALLGGGALTLFPDGSILHIPLNLLNHTAFNNYFIPGLILFIGLGVIPLITAIYLITEKPLKWIESTCLYKSVHWSWNFSLYIGFILIFWITIETYVLQVISFIHIFYFS